MNPPGKLHPVHDGCIAILHVSIEWCSVAATTRPSPRQLHNVHDPKCSKLFEYTHIFSCMQTSFKTTHAMLRQQCSSMELYVQQALHVSLSLAAVGLLECPVAWTCLGCGSSAARDLGVHLLASGVAEEHASNVLQISL